MSDESRQPAAIPGAFFEMTVSHVFHIAGRGTVAVGEDVLGEFRSGQNARIMREGHLVGRSVAYVELHARAGTTALILIEPGVTVEPGDVIQSDGGHEASSTPTGVDI